MNQDKQAKKSFNVSARGQKTGMKLAMTAAIDAGDDKTVKTILDIYPQAANWTCRGKRPGDEKKSSLMQAAEAGRTKIVRLLLNAGAKVDKEDRWGRTALMRAVICPDEVATRLLLQHGARVSDKDKEGSTVFLNFVAAQAFTIYGQKNDPAYKEHIETLDLLVEYGANVHEKFSARHTNYAGTPAIIALATSGNRDLLERLLDRHGADIETRDSRGMTPFLRACGTGGDSALLSSLISRGVNVKARNKSGETALHIAAGALQSTCLSYLLRATVTDINEADVAGDTPLHKAAARAGFALNCNYGPYSLKNITALVEKGADVLAVNAQGKTPLSVLQELREPEQTALEYLKGKTQAVLEKAAQEAKKVSGDTVDAVYTGLSQDMEPLQPLRFKTKKKPTP